jgi:hypothetical protein
MVGNIHEVGEIAKNREALWNYYGLGSSVINSSSLYDGEGIASLHDNMVVIVQGDFGPRFCALQGLRKMKNNRIYEMFRVECLADGKVKIASLSRVSFAAIYAQLEMLL